VIVVDASIAVKWIRWETDSADAHEFLERYRAQLIAPDMIISEVAGVIVREVNMGNWPLDEAKRLLSQWTGDWGAVAIDVRRVTPPIIERAGLLAIDIGHPIGDCIYLALALEEGAELATADAKFVGKVAGRHGRCRLLGDYVCS
jgi:predicted nucleic acid-binding protein